MRCNTNNDYIRQKSPAAESYDTDHLITKTEGRKPQLPYEFNTNFRTKAKHFWQSLLPGWRKGLALNSLYTSIILLVNIIWLLAIVLTSKSEQGIYTIYEGSCSRTSVINSWLHVLINILSTALLGSSNYTVQCLLAPTRKEVDRAHRKGRWLYIGILDMKNLWWISWRRKLLAILLVISTWPLHLLWNSVVFKTLQANQYGVLIVSTDFISSEEFDDNLSNLNFSAPWADSFLNRTTFLNFSKSLYKEAHDPRSMIRLENAECMKTYIQPIIDNRRNLLLITNTTLHPLSSTQSLRNGSILAYMDSQHWQFDFNTAGGMWIPGAFICQPIIENIDGSNFGFYGPCSLDKALKYADNWIVTVESDDNGSELAYEIDYCLSEVVPEVCQVQILLPIMVLVIICNFVKLICVISTIFTFQEPPLVVIGDALASFLENRDNSLLHFKKPKFLPQLKHWADVVRLDLVIVTILSSITLGLVGYLLRVGLIAAADSGQTFHGLGFGQVNPNAVIGAFKPQESQSLKSLLKVIIVVNSPQVVFTLLYFIYNRTYTKMLAAHEWTKFATQHRSLRVSQPIGIQRSTYWLHLPYHYSIPLLIASGSMHWIISESIFLVRVAFYDKTGSEDSIPVLDIEAMPGYSPESIVAAITLGATMLLTLFLLSCRRFGRAVPLVKNNSWLICNVCHRPDDDNEAASKAVKWGAISHSEGDKAGHCCLTSFEVEKPIEGGLYI